MYIEAMFKVDDFVNELCKRWKFDAKGEIDCEEYMRACLAHEVRTHARHVHSCVTRRQTDRRTA